MTAMKNDRPADTTMMGVVHDALRRDLRRLDHVLADAGPPCRRLGVKPWASTSSG